MSSCSAHPRRRPDKPPVQESGAHVDDTRAYGNPLGFRHPGECATTWRPLALPDRGGPLFTLLLVGSSAAAASFTHSARTRTIAAALCTAAVVRILIVGPRTLLGLPTDERALGQFLDVAPQLLGIAQLVLAAAAVTAIYQRFPAQDRRPFMTWAASGALLGLVSGLALGPVLGLPVGTLLR